MVKAIKSLSEYESQYPGITEFYEKVKKGEFVGQQFKKGQPSPYRNKTWESLTSAERNNFFGVFERNFLKPTGLFAELKVNPEKLKKFKEDVANNSRIEIREMYGTKGKPLSESVLSRIVRQFGITKFGKSGRERAAILKVKPEVTKNANKILNILKNNPEISVNELFLKSNLKKTDFEGAAQALKVDKSYAGKKRFNIPENLKDKIKKIAVPRTVEETLTEKKVLKPKEIKKSFTDPRKAISEFFEKGTVFEHTFPRALIPFFKGTNNKKVLEITGTRTSPFLNIFKRRYDNLQRGAVSKFLEDGDLKSYNKTINNIRDTVKKATGGYETGYIKFDKNKKATPVVNATPVTEGFKQFGVETNQRMSAFKNAKYSSNLLKNYLKDPDSEIFNTLKTEFPPERISKDLIKNLDTAAKSYDKAEPFVGNIKKFTTFAKNNISNPLVKALFKTSYGKAALVGGAVLTPSLLAAEEDPIKYNDEIGAFVNPQTDDKVSQATLLDWAANNPMPTAAIASTPLLSKTVRKGTGKLLKGLLSTRGSSAAGLTFAGMTVKDNLDEGKNIVDATVDPLVGLELLYPEAAKRFGGKGLQNALGRALSLGRVGAMMTPVGLGITALGVGKELYNVAQEEQDRINEMRENDPMAYQEYLAEQQELMDVSA